MLCAHEYLEPRLEAGKDDELRQGATPQGRGAPDGVGGPSVIGQQCARRAGQTKQFKGGLHLKRDTLEYPEKWRVQSSP